MSVEEIKTPKYFVEEEKNEVIASASSQVSAAASDGDDALKLAGTHAHQFDEQYNLRLRRKIVCLPCLALPLTH